MTKCILVSINFLLNISAVFERAIMRNIPPLVMTEKIKKARDKNKTCAAVLTDLSKAFDCLKHDLLIAKLHAFGFDYKSLRVMYTYLNNRVQVTKVSSYYSKILDIIFGVP